MKAIIATILLAGIASGGGRKRIGADPFDEVIPQVVFGGGWSTSISITNLDDTSIRIPVAFRRTNGQVWSVPIVGRAASATHTVDIPAHGTAFLELPDGSGDLQQGWAILDIPCCPNVGGFAVFRQSVPGRPDFEGVVPFADSFEERSVLMFDNTRGFATGIALVNPREFGGTLFTLVFRDEAGNRIHLDQITIPRQQQQVFVLADRFPQTANRRGSMEIQGVSSYISALGLRFSPGGAFTSFHSFEP